MEAVEPLPLYTQTGAVKNTDTKTPTRPSTSHPHHSSAIPTSLHPFLPSFLSLTHSSLTHPFFPSPSFPPFLYHHYHLLVFFPCLLLFYHIVLFLHSCYTFFILLRLIQSSPFFLLSLYRCFFSQTLLSFHSIIFFVVSLLFLSSPSPSPQCLPTLSQFCSSSSLPSSSFLLLVLPFFLHSLACSSSAPSSQQTTRL